MHQLEINLAVLRGMTEFEQSSSRSFATSPQTTSNTVRYPMLISRAGWFATNTVRNRRRRQIEHLVAGDSSFSVCIDVCTLGKSPDPCSRELSYWSETFCEPTCTSVRTVDESTTGNDCTSSNTGRYLADGASSSPILLVNLKTVWDTDQRISCCSEGYEACEQALQGCYDAGSAWLHPALPVPFHSDFQTSWRGGASTKFLEVHIWDAAFYFDCRSARRRVWAQKHRYAANIV